MKKPYKAPRVSVGDLRTPVIFYQYQASAGPEPGEEEFKVMHKCFAKIDEVWSKDLELAKSNGTLSDITLTIRDTQGEYIPSNKDYLEIKMDVYAGRHFNIKHFQPDPQNRDFIKVIAGVVN